MAETKGTKKRSGGKPAPKPAAKRTSGKANSSAKKAEGQKTLSSEVQGILIIAGGLFLLMAFLTTATGAVGSFLRDIFYGLLGFASAISCVFVIVTGVQVFLNKAGRRNTTRYLLLGGIVLVTSILVALGCGVDNTQGSLVEQIAALWQRGIDGYGGGVIGGGICRILAALLGVGGSWVLALALELVLIILLTEVSLEAIFRKFGKLVKRQSDKVAEVAETPIEMPPHTTNQVQEKSSFWKSIFGKKTEEPTPVPAPKREERKSGDFFSGYFAGEEPLSGQPAAFVEDGPKDAQEIPVRRFTFREDDELLKNILPPEEEKENLPFTIDNMRTGVISELPVTGEDGSVTTQENPEDADPVFTPPSEAKIEDTPELSTKMAMEAGVPLDRAVVAGRRMLAEDGPLSPEEEIMAELEEQSIAPPRMIEYYMPTLDLLDPPEPRTRTREEIKAELEEKANRLLDTLRSFKVEAWITNITQGPSVTRFELQPGVGVKVSKITSLTDDIALSLAAPGVRIEAPIPGKSAIGIEIPNKEASPVPIREVLESDKFQHFQSKTAFALGKDIGGSCVVADIAKFPHVLIAGQTGSGKSVCINSLILSILFKAKPDEVKLIMVDPKMVELGIYNGIPHLLIPVVTDPKHAAGALNWAVVEMQNRYNLLKDNNVRNLKGYNALMEERGEPDSKLPEIVIIIDEFADLMLAAKSEVEDAINRLAALARAAGMYLVIATQRPTVNVITGVIKANIPSRIAFNVTSQVDSRTIIDMTGAEKLLGRGDMLYNPSGSVKPQRIQGNFVSDAEIERVIEFIKGQYEAQYDEEVLENIRREQERISANLDGSSHHEDEDGATRSGSEARDELFVQAVEMVLENGQASVAMFQRRFKIGYQRAARLIDQMEERRIIGPYEGTKPRQVLITRQEFNEMLMNQEE